MMATPFVIKTNNIMFVRSKNKKKKTKKGFTPITLLHVPSPNKRK